MGKEAFLRYPELVNQANSEIGYSLSDICLEDKDSQLGQTQYTQPALYLVSYLEALSKIEDGQSPTLAAGHSVGEFAALATADAVSFLDGLAARYFAPPRRHEHKANQQNIPAFDGNVIASPCETQNLMPCHAMLCHAILWCHQH